MAQPPVISLPKVSPSMRDVGFALGIVAILCVLFLPIPVVMVDIGLAFSIALSVLILMVALWIQRPLDFSSFPTVLLIATMIRLSLNIATTRVILSHGNEGPTAAGGGRALTCTAASSCSCTRCTGRWAPRPRSGRRR